MIEFNGKMYYYQIFIKKIFLSKGVDEQLLALLNNLFVYNPANRISALNSMMHPFFKEIKFKACKINNKVLPPLFNFSKGKNFKFIFRGGKIME